MNNSIPNHVAIIMDGNGRWAKSRGLARPEGHKQGLATAEKIIDFSLKRGIKFLSLYVFSTENWKRPRAEVASLFNLAEKYLSQFEEFCKDRVRVVVSGEKDGLPRSLRAKIEQTEQKTHAFDAICVNLCINYGGRQDIAQAAQKVVSEGGELTEQSIAEHLYNAFIPSPDILIRTGGEKRLSNFLLFQSAYSELFFTETLWPSFSEEEYDRILDEFSHRTRTFGGI